MQFASQHPQFPFQIMPATRGRLSQEIIEQFPHVEHSLILIHMNYSTRVFSPRASEHASQQLEMYRKLAERIGTHDILIHLPESPAEYDNLAKGFEIIDHALISRGISVHFEIPAWTKAMHTRFTNIDQYLTPIMEVLTKMRANIVFDTAHLHSIGLSAAAMIILIEKYKRFVKYIHLNGNCKPMRARDMHVPIFSDNNLIADWEALVSYLVAGNYICIAESGNIGASYAEWRAFAQTYEFTILPPCRLGQF
jgi:endonuclease IV